VTGLYLSLLILVLISIEIHIHESSIIKMLSSAFGLLGLFLISFISCLSIIPIPYIVIVFKIAGYVNPILTSIVVGIGSGLGEAIAWFFGRASYSVLKETVYAKRINVLLKFMEQRWSFAVPFLAFIFSLTFLPDKVLYLPLGIMRYNVLKMLPFTVLGKTMMVYLVLLFGRLWSNIIDFESDFTSFIVTVMVLSITMTVMVLVDWEKIIFGKKR
ncbi:MAG: hypothetical protein QXX61_05610, partial [Ignisphaera sp.]